MKIENQHFQSCSHKLMQVLRSASTTTYYKTIFKEIGINVNDDISYDDFMRIPIIDKSIYKTNSFDLISPVRIQLFDKKLLKKMRTLEEKDNYLSQMGLMMKITSGSTGQPLEVIKSKLDNKRDYLHLNQYRRKISGYNFRGKYIWVWPVNPLMLKYMGDNQTSNYIKKDDFGYMYFLYEYSEKNIFDLYNVIIENNCEWITASPTVITKLSCFIEKNNLKTPLFAYIECHSEKLHAWQIEIIKRVFHINPVSIYSSNEVQFIGATCEENHMHAFESSCFIEFINFTGLTKEIVVTSLNYLDIPMIRYKLGDCGDWICDQIQCKLHSNPIFELKGFRTNDFILTKNNTKMEPFIITDSIYLLSKNSSVNLHDYHVKQTAYDCFEYYFSEYDLSRMTVDSKIFLEKYLCELLRYPITVNILHLKNYGISVNKHKYFEVSFT